MRIEQLRVHQLFEMQARKTPDARALTKGGSSLTYKELNTRANQLAHFLRTRGVGPNVLVGVCLERSLAAVVAIYAVLKAGGAYVPLDPAYPAERLGYMLRSSASRLVISASSQAAKLEEAGCEVLLLEEQSETLSGFAGTDPEPLGDPSNLIYVIFTSGSTGRPKAAGVYHRGFSNLIHWFVTEFRINAEDGALLVSSLSFDLTQKNLYATLLSGGRLHLPTQDTFDPVQLIAQIRKERVTLINCTPSAFYPLVEASGPSYAELAPLRYAFLGGEKISVDRLRAWQDSESCGCQVVNTYGPTECTDICAFCRMDQGLMQRYSSVPIGRQIPNTVVMVVDGQGNRCPQGQAGELWIGGAGVGAGYLNDAEMTATRFVENRFPEVPGPRLYRSGDSVRLLPDGNLEFLGRLDHQVKLRGYRVELPEIERALQEHGSVKEAVAVVQKGTERLVAYYTPDAQPPTGEELRSHLAGKLPDYMVPAAFVELERFPLSPNGKVDRHAVSDLSTQEPQETVAVNPQDSVESRLISIWHSALGHNNIDVHDNFFDIGGDSISITRVQSLIQRALGRTVSVTDLFQYPTVRSLARYLHDAQSISAAGRRVAQRAQRQRSSFGWNAPRRSSHPR